MTFEPRFYHFSNEICVNQSINLIAFFYLHHNFDSEYKVANLGTYFSHFQAYFPIRWFSEKECCFLVPCCLLFISVNCFVWSKLFSLKCPTQRRFNLDCKFTVFDFLSRCFLSRCFMIRFSFSISGIILMILGSSTGQSFLPICRYLFTNSGYMRPFFPFSSLSVYFIVRWSQNFWEVIKSCAPFG